MNVAHVLAKETISQGVDRANLTSQRRRNIACDNSSTLQSVYMQSVFLQTGLYRVEYLVCSQGRYLEGRGYRKEREGRVTLQ